MKHECTQLLRSREIKSVSAVRAYGFYGIWLAKQKRTNPPIESFMTSAYYSSFLKFEQWSKETNIPKPEKYIELMVTNQISPALWRRSEAYLLFLEWTDKVSDPMHQVTITIETMISLSDEYAVEMSKVFDNFSCGDMIEAIHQRQLSPWFLFCSKSFKLWSSKLHESERSILFKNIGLDYWKKRLEDSVDIVNDIKKIVESLGV